MINDKIDVNLDMNHEFTQPNHRSLVFCIHKYDQEFHQLVLPQHNVKQIHQQNLDRKYVKLH